MASTSKSLTPKQVIDDIRCGFVDETGEMIKSSANQIAQDALEGYAHDLNAEVAHFLEEMIQNFDDAEFSCSTPTVTISDHDTHLLVSTNENGMSESNVRAICTIRRGTKINSPNNIGEKGIGFKTTFKAANKVWIRSAGYTFSLDRQRLLGMAIPIWENFPPDLSHLIEHGKTQFLLEYRDQTRADDVRSALPRFDSKILLFLRQLREINVTLNINNKRTVTRKDVTIWGGIGTELTTIENKRSDTIRYVIQKEVVKCTPPSEDGKRSNLTSSEVTIALPVMDETALPFQNAHNFLPIRMTQFKFLINADFKLLQNRADLDGDPENTRWNANLMQGLASCLVSAIKRLNHHEGGQLFWLRFLPVDFTQDSFMPLRTSIKTLVEREQLLFSSNGSLVRGNRLLLVPKEVRDSNNKLFFEPSGTDRFVLSTMYDRCPSAALKFLQVTYMDKGSFLNCFKTYVANNTDAFHSASTEWHAAIAGKLLNYSYHQLSCVPIIPLTNGGWIASASGGDIFFSCSAKSDEFSIPFSAGSLGDIYFVSKPACLDPNWRRLMANQRVEPLDKARVCAKIRAVHNQSIPPTKNTQDLLSHAKFLFKCDASSYYQLWVVNSRDQVVLADQTHMDDPNDKYPLSVLFEGSQSETSSLNSSYISAYTGHHLKEWHSFLATRLKVQNSLKVITGHAKNERVTEEFKHVVKYRPSKVWLLMLVQNWFQFGHLLSKYKTPGLTIPDESGWCIRGEKVKTIQHGMQFLKETALPLDTLKSLDLGDLQLIDIDMAESTDWTKLATFGVTCSDADVEIQFMLLKRAKESSSSTTTIFSIYGRLQALCRRSGANQKKVRKSFEATDYLYYPPQQTWHSLQQCLWSSEFDFLDQKVLELHYSDHQYLCQDVLNIHEATFDTVLAAVKAYPAPAMKDIPDLICLLEVLSKQIQSSTENALKLFESGCMSKPLIPLSRAGKTIFEPLSSTQQYLLNDRESYEGVFDDSCWQVCCLPASARAMSSLFSGTGQLARYLNNEHRLSVCIQEDVVHTGEVGLDVDRTEWIIEKVPFIQALASAGKSDDTSVKERVARFKNVTVHHVEGIEIRPYYQGSPDRKIYGNARHGTVHINTDTTICDGCKIYVDAQLRGLKGQASFFGEIDTQLSQYLNIVDKSRKALMKEIITANNDAKCIELLQIQGITVTKTMLEQRPKMDLPVAKSDDHISNSSSVPKADGAILPVGTAVRDSADSTTTDAQDSTVTSSISSLSLHPNISTSLSNQLVSTVTRRASDDEKHIRTGMNGELFVYNLLKKALGDQFDEDNWTSELRHRADPALTQWRRPDTRDYADFTIGSPNDKFLSWLGKHVKKKYLKELTDATTFHIEVKTTNGRANEPFHLSNIQWQHLQALHAADENDEVYLIIRVYRLASSPQFEVIIDPFKRCYQGQLKVEGVDGLVCTLSS